MLLVTHQDCFAAIFGNVNTIANLFENFAGYQLVHFIVFGQANFEGAVLKGFFVICFCSWPLVRMQAVGCQVNEGNYPLNRRCPDCVRASSIYSFICTSNYNSLRSLATGIFICSRYLATVRRAIL